MCHLPATLSCPGCHFPATHPGPGQASPLPGLPVPLASSQGSLEGHFLPQALLTHSALGPTTLAACGCRTPSSPLTGRAPRSGPLITPLRRPAQHGAGRRRWPAMAEGRVQEWKGIPGRFQSTKTYLRKPGTFPGQHPRAEPALAGTKRVDAQE
ncbi:Hypothetical predicted protein [Marmota monax]|uniref:Uncharacterized protein n=1 Tax=Marmota monax TaxID=9995 RepID=A0A5E4CA60_MARMO|nr:Hypothetical predicted protein [Marmota monax]